MTRKPPNMAASKRVKVATRLDTAGEGEARDMKEHRSAVQATKSSRRARK